MAPITRGSITNLLSPDLHAVFVETGKDRPLEYPKYFNVSQMETNPQTDQQISGLGTMPEKPEGTGFTKDDPIIGGRKAYTATPYGLAVEITWEAWRDELYGALKEMIACLKRAAVHRQEVQAWSVLNNAFSTSYAGFTSGEALCSTGHTGLDTTSRANRPSPDIGLSITGIQNAITRFEDMTDERGLPRLMTMSMLLIGSANKFVAREILGSGGKPGTAQNEINALEEEDLRYMVCHYFTSATQWFGSAGQGTHDLNYLWRDEPIFDMLDDPRTKNAISTAYERFAVGYGSWRGIDGSTG
jgi:hypothetical protein